MKRKTDDQIKDELRAIYAGQDGAIPDMTRLDRRESSRVTRVLVGAVLALGLLSAVAWAGFFAWSRGGIGGGERPLVTRVEISESVRSGEETFITFRYENAGPVPIAALSAKLTLPEGFAPTSMNPPPTDADALTWTLGSLSRGSDGAIAVGGIFRSEVPSTQTLQAMFTYRPANFSSDFQDIATARANVTDSIVRLTVSGPEKALPGDDATYVINVQNVSAGEARDVRIALSAPEEFSVASADPAADPDGTDVWTLPSLAAGELKAITVHGTFAAFEGGERTLTARAAFLDASKVAYTQAEARAVTDVLAGALSFGLVVDGSAGDQTADPGDTLRVSIDYGNAGNESARDVAFELAISGDAAQIPVDWAKADLAGATRAGTTLTWDATNLPGLADFTPGTSGTIDLALPLASSLTAGSTAGALTFALRASAEQIGSVVGTRSIDATPVVIRINSDFMASARAEYYTPDGEPVGTGPLPPAVGQTTSYRIVWNVSNAFHPLADMRMTANLPPRVAWTGKSSAAAGTIAFDETTRMVTWYVPAFPASLPASEATFEVAITPEPSDAGAFFKLTNAIAAEATDTVTRDQVAHGIDILTTELPEDEDAAGKGVVAE